MPWPPTRNFQPRDLTGHGRKSGRNRGCASRGFGGAFLAYALARFVLFGAGAALGGGSCLKGHVFARQIRLRAQPLF